MSALAHQQAAFLGAIMDADAPLDSSVSAAHARGLAIYRNNYRTSLIEALRATYERTERLVGEDAFDRAAAHHCIVHPPSSWTLDLAGEGFAETCRELFARDHDVAELAALEWAMHEAFTARGDAALTPAGFAEACAHFGESDWDGLILSPLAHVRSIPASYDLVRLWSSLAADDSTAESTALEGKHCAIVWREGERPVFAIRPAWEGEALAQFRRGASFGEICGVLASQLGEHEGAAQAGAMLARWIGEGLIGGIAQ